MSSDVSDAGSIIGAIALMMEARTSEMSVDIDLTTRQYIPEDSELRTRRRENLKPHMGNKHIHTLSSDWKTSWKSKINSNNSAGSAMVLVHEVA
jgi:hypothetical protein